MSKPQRTREGKWAIYHAVTGQQIERWPVDARAMLATGEYVAVPPSGASPLPPPTPEERGIVEKPDAAFPRDKHGEGPQALVHHAPAGPQYGWLDEDGKQRGEAEAPAPDAEPRADATPDPPPVPQDRSALPPGYRTERHRRYVALYGPDGEMVKSTMPSGLHDGQDAALAAAWTHTDGG